MVAPVSDRNRRCKDPKNVLYWGGTLAFWAMQGSNQFEYRYCNVKSDDSPGIVIIRISVMYEHSRKIIILLATCYALEVIPTTIIQILSAPPKNGVTSGV